MILHDAPETFLELVNATASYIGVPAVYVEKDYWGTLALKRLHQSEHKHDIVFKGGTALSKAHKLIERFSEDIDLAARANDLGDSRRKRLIRNAETAMTQDLTYQRAHTMESKSSRFRKTAHAFPTLTDASKLGQVSDIILVEINAFTDPLEIWCTAIRYPMTKKCWLPFKPSKWPSRTWPLVRQCNVGSWWASQPNTGHCASLSLCTSFSLHNLPGIDLLISA